MSFNFTSSDTHHWDHDISSSSYSSVRSLAMWVWLHLHPPHQLPARGHQLSQRHQHRVWWLPRVPSHVDSQGSGAQTNVARRGQCFLLLSRTTAQHQRWCWGQGHVALHNTRGYKRVSGCPQLRARVQVGVGVWHSRSEFIILFRCPSSWCHHKRSVKREGFQKKVLENFHLKYKDLIWSQTFWEM